MSLHEIQNWEMEMSDYGDAKVVIAIARWRSLEKEHELRIKRAAMWVERKVSELISWISSSEFGIIWFRSTEEYSEYLENIELTLSPEPLRQKFRSEAIDTLIQSSLSLWPTTHFWNQD